MNEYLLKAPLRMWWLTALLIAVNCGLFIGQVLSGVSPTAPDGSDLIHWGADFAPLTLSSENWRLLSSMFLHIGIGHLLLNMWALYLFGVYAEFYYGRLWYIGLFVLAGIAGNLASNYVSLHHALEFLNTAILQASTNTGMASNSLAPSISAGASGAIMGLGGALLVAALWPRTDIAPKYLLNKNALIMLSLLNLGLGMLVSGINGIAHLGGFAAGLVLALGYRVSLNFSAISTYSLQVVLIAVSLAALLAIDYWLIENARQLLHFWSIYLIQLNG